MKLKKIGFVTVCKYIAVFALMLIVSGAKLFELNPFGTGLFMALVFLGFNIGAMSGIYVAASVICDFSLNTFIASIIVAVVFIAAKLIEYKAKKKMNVGFIALPAFVSQAGYVYFMVASGRNVLQIFLSVFFALVFMYVCICFFRPLVITKLKYKLVDYEIICGCIVLVIAALGLSFFEIAGFPVVAMIGSFAICLATFVSGVRAGLVTGICIGIGCALRDNDITMLAAFSFIALLSAMFVNAPRIIGAAADVLAYIMFAFYFNTDYSNSLLFIIALSAGGLIYAVLPKRLLDKVRDYFSGAFSRTALRFVVNHNRNTLGNSLYKVSDIFYEMSGLMNGLKSEIGEKQLETLSQRLEENFCGRCNNRALCGGKGGMKDARSEVLRISVKKGRASVMDLPQEITENCVKVAQLISYAADISAEYNKHMRTLENENMAKNIVSEQLLGISGILKDIGYRESRPLSYDTGRERAIIEELTYRNIICSEALVTGKEFPAAVTMVIMTECYNKQLIEKVLEKIMRTNMSVVTVEESILSGWSVVLAEAAPKYDVVFGFAACPKSQSATSGDTHSFIKIHNNKFMVALCDGMGSGERARQFSETTISLIENFYRAGFEHDIVLESVNKFLSLSSDEIFSAVDVCVVDLDTGEADLIKIGSPPSYIKNKETVLRVDGNALPIGLLDEMRPSVSTQRLKEGDMIVLTTDGVSDSFEGDGLAQLINNAGGKNPQQLCTSLIERTLENDNNVSKDDMTVSAIRIFSRT